MKQTAKNLKKVNKLDAKYLVIKAINDFEISN